jgi:hypothetical protein
MDSYAAGFAKRDTIVVPIDHVCGLAIASSYKARPRVPGLPAIDGHKHAKRSVAPVRTGKVERDSAA